MKLSDVMSAAGLASYAEVGLVLFLIAFVLVAIRVVLFERSEDLEIINKIPLDEERTHIACDQEPQEGVS